MVDRGIRRRCCRRRPAGFQDRRTARGHRGDERVLDPLAGDQVQGRATGHPGVVQVRVLRGGVVAPHGQVLDVVHRSPGLRREHGHGPVVVQPGERAEPGRGNVRGVALGDQRVGVGGVAGDHHAHVVVRHVVQGPALLGEDRAVGLQEVTPLHAFRTRAGADEQGQLGAVEHLSGVRADLHVCEQRERAVLQLHDRALQSGQCGRDLEQPQPDGALTAQEVSVRDPEEQAVADLAGGSGDGHGDGCEAHGFSSWNG